MRFDHKALDLRHEHVCYSALLLPEYHLHLWYPKEVPHIHRSD